MFHPPKKYRHRDINGHPLKPETLMMSYGTTAVLEGSVKCPVFQTSTFAFKTRKRQVVLRTGLRPPRAAAGRGAGADLLPRETTPTSRFSKNGSASGTRPNRAGVLVGHGGHLHHDVQRAAAGGRAAGQRAGLRRHGIPGREHPAQFGISASGSGPGACGLPSTKRSNRHSRSPHWMIYLETPPIPPTAWWTSPGARKSRDRWQTRPAGGRSWRSTTRFSARCGSGRWRTARTSLSTR